MQNLEKDHPKRHHFGGSKTSRGYSIALGCPPLQATHACPSSRGMLKTELAGARLSSKMQ
jgi:hypothetical protein